MNRKDFLKGLGLAGIGSLISAPILKAGNRGGKAPMPPNCTLIPTETAGPFPLDLTANAEFFRQDVREDRTGVQLNLKLKIIGADNCEPMPNSGIAVRTGCTPATTQMATTGSRALPI